MNEYLRKEVKILKALQGISYKELAEYLEVKVNSLYSWLRGNYDFSEDYVISTEEDKEKLF